MRVLLTFILVLLASLAFAQDDPNGNIAKGNSLYHEGKFEEAEVEYRKAQEEESDPFITQFNLPSQEVVWPSTASE